MARRDFDIPVVQIMNHVGGIEQLGDGGVDVLLGLLESIFLVRILGRILEVEREILASVRTIVVEVAVPALPIFVGEGL